MTQDLAPKPYKGPESYQAEDAALFFGRDQEADQLIAKIASSRFTLLHAQSGAGKTSLLNAKVIPGLQNRSWLPIRVLPQNDPVESIRVTTLQTLFPPLAVEREAIQAARDALLPAGEDASIAGILQRYDALGVREPQSQILVHRRRATNTVKGSVFPDSAEYDPVFCRLLRGNIDVAQLSEHLAAVQNLSPVHVQDLPAIEPTMPLRGLQDRIAQIEQFVNCEQIVSMFYAPVPDLYTFFENIVETYGNKCAKFGVVLMLDQFEEVFTRFVDTGNEDLELPNPPLDWRLRWELFDELRRLYLGPSDGASPLPIRFVVSMRDEYIAQLDPIRKFVPDLDSCAYHLTMLNQQAAELAIREPAQHFGYTYSTDCFRQIVAQLTKENRWVEPTHLQIVCEKLWFYRGRKLSADSPEGREQLPSIEVKELEDLNGAAGILRSFFREFLAELDPEKRAEVLDMLEQLVTSGGTRNIVERNDLTHPKYGKWAVREFLLSRLEQRTIVRLESRLGGQFAEITHEFLIGPILEALRAELTDNPEYGRLRHATRLLEMFDGVDSRGPTGRLLDEDGFRWLNQIRTRIRWAEWSVELMLRSAVTLGVSGPDLAFWVGQFEALPFDTQQFLAQIADGTWGTRVLTFELLSVLEASDLQLSDPAAKLVLRSLLILAADSQRNAISQWTRRLVKDGTA